MIKRKTVFLEIVVMRLYKVKNLYIIKLNIPQSTSSGRGYSMKLQGDSPKVKFLDMSKRIQV